MRKYQVSFALSSSLATLLYAGIYARRSVAVRVAQALLLADDVASVVIAEVVVTQ